MLSRIHRRLEDGLRLIQVRDRDLPRREAFVRDVVRAAHRFGARVLVSGGSPLADGAHFTAAQLMALHERPASGLAAASCHDAAELSRAMTLGLDFAVLGPVRPTATHPEGRPLGLDGFARLVRGASIPVYAVGGMTRSDLESVWRAGGHGVAMITGAWPVVRNGV